MTTRERVYAAIEQHLLLHGYAPTVRELQVMVGLGSPSTVQEHLNNLEADGLISRSAGKQRTIRLVSRGAWT